MAAVAFHLALPETPPLPEPLAEALPEVVDAPPSLPPPLPPPRAVTLKVSGGKPLKMRAILLAEGSSHWPGAAAWHELAIYRREHGEHAVAVRSHDRAPGAVPFCRAEVFPNLAEAMAWVEEFDPTADLAIPFDLADRTVRAADMALDAAAFRIRAEELTRRWQAMLGEVLCRVDAQPCASLD
jgi:hypothetical protein